LDLGANTHHGVAAATNDAKNTAFASLVSAARGNLRGIATTGSRGHVETVVRKTSIVARVGVSIDRMCGLDALLVHCELWLAITRWLSAAVHGKPWRGETCPAGWLRPSKFIDVNHSLGKRFRNVFKEIVFGAITDHPVCKIP
jgi:hypothetical protein